MNLCINKCLNIFRYKILNTMRWILNIFVIGIVLIPFACSAPIALGDGYYLPQLENIESHIGNLWKNFKKGYGFVYNTTTEEFYRFQIFANHVKMIVKHNLEHDLGLHTYRLGINKFATLVNKSNVFKRLLQPCFILFVDK